MWRKWNPSPLLVGMQTGAANVENSMEFPQKTMLRLHNGILHSRKKEGTPTFHNGMDGTGEHYAK